MADDFFHTLQPVKSLYNKQRLPKTDGTLCIYML
jgi:hypothetical protein